MVDILVQSPAGTIKWFKREAETILSFDHPHIPKCVDQFDAFATSFIAFEFIDGASLAELLECDGPFDEESVLALRGTLASALRYAHANGIVHRDVKPSNCMVTKAGRVLLMDFGLAVPYFGGSTEEQAITGTPAYLSPEQFCGEIRPESDWFSLGCVGYELMTGTRLLNPQSFQMLAETFFHWDVPQIVGRWKSQFPRATRYLESFLSLHPESRTEHLQEVVRHAGPLPLKNRGLPEKLAN